MDTSPNDDAATSSDSGRARSTGGQAIVVTRATTRATAGAITMASRSYLSTQHLWAATHFADLAEKYEEAYAESAPIFHIHLRAYVLSCITESVAFIEALINEFFQDIFEDHTSYVEPVAEDAKDKIRRYWKESGLGKTDSILYKYAVARILAGHPAQEADRNPHQDATLLIELRNWLVHYRPDTLSENRPHKLAAKLRSKFGESPLMKGASNPFFPDRALGAACAQWAKTSAKNFADEFSSVFGIRPNYQRVQHPTQPPPIPEKSVQSGKNP